MNGWELSWKLVLMFGDCIFDDFVFIVCLLGGCRFGCYGVWCVGRDN